MIEIRMKAEDMKNVYEGIEGEYPVYRSKPPFDNQMKRDGVLIVDDEGIRYRANNEIKDYGSVDTNNKIRVISLIRNGKPITKLSGDDIRENDLPNRLQIFQLPEEGDPNSTEYRLSTMMKLDIRALVM